MKILKPIETENLSRQACHRTSLNHQSVENAKPFFYYVNLEEISFLLIWKTSKAKESITHLSLEGGLNINESGYERNECKMW